MTRILVPSGVLGLGFDAKALATGIARKPDIICIDGGSTDSGPFYLGSSSSKYARAACKAEWRQLMLARAQAAVPLVIGSCGTCGTDAMVDWMYEISCELAQELGQQLSIARLYSSQTPSTINEAYQAERITPLEAAPILTSEHIDASSNIVALAGAEHIIAALNTGADIILAGRTTDTAIISALPLLRGDHAGAAWHGAKIAECGALCSTNPTSGVILLDVDQESFSVEPLAEDAACTPHSVSAHMLYENANPHKLFEPGGYLDVAEAHYSAVDEKRVRVTGSQWTTTQPYSVKLEAARIVGFQSTIMAILRDERYVCQAQDWLDRLEPFLAQEITSHMCLTPEDYHLEFRLIGINSVLGKLENRISQPTEVGVLGLITASDQATASEIAKLINPFVLHYPLTDNEDLPTFAFPYSPADSERGALYEFSLNHLLILDQPLDAFRLVVDTING